MMKNDFESCVAMTATEVSRISDPKREASELYLLLANDPDVDRTALLARLFVAYGLDPKEYMKKK